MDVFTATQRINDILRDLEASTGAVVESIELRDIDSTTVGHLEREILRSVAIQMQRIPSTKWV